jgi:hypothetical protein
MRKFLTVLVAIAAIGVTAVATSGTADARWGGGGGWHGGGGWRGGGWRGGWGWGPGPFVAGALIGGALAAPYYYGGYGYGYGYGPGPYGPYGPYPYGCRRVWNGYYWVRGCY